MKYVGKYFKNYWVSKATDCFVLFLTEQAWSHGGLWTRELGQDPSHVSMGD